MYILIDRDRLPEGRHYELMPDGRAIVSGREARMMGTLDGVTVVTGTAQLEQMRRQMAVSRNQNNKKED